MELRRADREREDALLVRLQSDVDAWELKVRDERPITDKSWALLVLRKLSYSSTEDSTEVSTEASTAEETS